MIGYVSPTYWGMLTWSCCESFSFNGNAVQLVAEQRELPGVD